MIYSNILNTVEFGSILIFNQEDHTFYYEAVTNKLAELYNLSSEDFKGKPLYFLEKNNTNNNINININIDVDKCHKKFNDLINKSIKFGFSLDLIKLLIKEKNEPVLIFIVSLRLEPNKVLNLGFNIDHFEELIIKEKENLYLNILNILPFKIILINNNLNIIYINKVKNIENKTNLQSLFINNDEVISDIKEFIKSIHYNNTIQKEYKIDGKYYKLNLTKINEYKNKDLFLTENPIKEEDKFLIFLEDNSNVFEIKNQLFIVNDLLEKEKDKISIILKGYSEKKVRDVNTSRNIDLIKKITSKTLKEKIKEDQMYDKQIYSLLKDIEIIKKDINKIDNQVLLSNKNITEEINNIVNYLNKLDYILSTLTVDLKKIKDNNIKKDDLNIITILKNTSKNQLIIFFVIIIISSTIFQKLIMERIKNIINDPLIIIEQLIE